MGVRQGMGSVWNMEQWKGGQGVGVGKLNLECKKKNNKFLKIPIL